MCHTPSTKCDSDLCTYTRNISLGKKKEGKREVLFQSSTSIYIKEKKGKRKGGRRRGKASSPEAQDLVSFFAHRKKERRRERDSLRLFCVNDYDLTHNRLQEKKKKRGGEKKCQKTSINDGRIAHLSDSPRK